MLPEDSLPMALIDPVCGRSVNAASPHSCVRGGAMFYFCSDACRKRFTRDPLRFVVINIPQRDEPAPIQDRPVSVVHNDLVVRPHEEPGRPRTAEQSAQKATWEQELQPSGGLRGLIASWLRAREERRHAKRVSQELLALHRTISADHSGLASRELYQRVVMARTGCDSKAADTILACAEESFAKWPVSRELTFCDVVHYLSVSEYLAAHEGQYSINSDINLVVTSNVPPALCAPHKNENASDELD